MNPALIFALAVALAFAVAGILIAGRGSLRRGLSRVVLRLKGALGELLVWAVLGGAALLIAFVADGDAWTFVALAAAALCLIALAILVALRRKRD